MLGFSSEHMIVVSNETDPADPPKDEYMQAVEAGDMKIAAKLVHEAAMANEFDVGPVWHGSPKSEFHQFQIPSSGFNSNVFGSYEVSRNGAFFTLDRDAAAGYQTQGGRTSGGTRAFYLDAEFVDWRRGISDAQFNTLEDAGVNPRWLDQKGASWELFDAEEDPDGALVRGLQVMGYTGAIIGDTDGTNDFDSYVVFSPNQIKSADPVTYDDAGNPIPLEQRFDPSNPDIRY